MLRAERFRGLAFKPLKVTIVETMLVLVSARVPCDGQDRQPVTMHASLMSPVTTKFSRKGDVVAAKVTDPPDLKGAILEGEVQAVQKGSRHTFIQFTLQTVHQAEKATQVSVTLLSVANGRNEKDHDEEGALVEVSGETARMSFLHRGSGKDHASSEKDGHASSVRLTAEGSDLSFAVGSTLELEIATR